MSTSSFKLISRSSTNSSSSCSIPKSRFIWRFPPSKFESLPSCNSKRLSLLNLQTITIDQELLQRQDLSILIYDLALQLNVSFNCIYTAVIYMHRFFMLHPFQQSFKQLVAAACLFLACKVHEMARPLNEFSRHLCQLISLNNKSEHCSTTTAPNTTPEILSNYNQQIIDYENMLLSTLGFCLHIEQPFKIITKISQKLSIPMEIIEKAYDITTKSIFFTLFPMKYTNNLIACFALYLAITSSQINIPDNEDGSQWFHLLNEEFTEKLLKELVDEYQFIWMNKSSKKAQIRFDQIRQQKKPINQPAKAQTNGEQSNSKMCSNDNDQNNYPIATTSGSVRSTTSSSSSSVAHQQQQSNFYEHVDYHRTPNRCSSVNVVNGNYPSPLERTFIHSSSPKHNSNNHNGSYQMKNNNSMSITSAKPIPTLMTTTTAYTNLHQHSNNSRYHSRISAPVFQYPSSSSTTTICSPQRLYVPPSSLHPQAIVHQYPPNYVVNNCYYPQQQAPLFYPSQQDPTNLINKRYGEPPAPPTKRFRYSINPHEHY